MSGASGSRSGLTRRSFLKSTMAVAAAATAAGGATSLTALAEDVEVASGEDQVFYNYCRGNCGSSTCRLQGIVREGKLVQTKPLPVDPDHIEYKTGCVKGQFNPQRLYATRRVLYPLKRVGERGSGEFERISWDEAIQLAAEKFMEAQSQFGDSATCLYSSYPAGGRLNAGGWYFPDPSPAVPTVGIARFAYATGCSIMVPVADLCQMWMNRTFALCSANPSQMQYSKTIIFWAYNVTETSRDSWQFIAQARDNGTKLICIDPHYTTAAAGSDLWLPIRPATDGFMMLAMANYIVENHLEDEDFLREKTVAPFLRKDDGKFLRMSDLGVDPATEVNAKGQTVVVDHEAVWDEEAGTYGDSTVVKKPAIHGSFEIGGIKVQTTLDYVLDGIKEYTMEKAEEVCGLPKEKMIEVAEIYATNKPVGICSYEGLGHHYNSRHNYKNLNFLAALTGNAYVKGAFNNINPLNEDGTVNPEVNSAPMLQVENAKVPVKFSSQYIAEIMETGKLGDTEIPLKWLMVVGANLLASDSGRQALIEAVKKLDFFAVADPYLTDTALYADLVLPVALSWETLDTGGGYALFDKAVEPAGECKTNMDIYRLLSSAIGIDDLYPMTDEEYVRKMLDTEFNRENGFTYDDFKEKGFIRKFDPNATTANASGTVASTRVKFYVEEVKSKDFNGIVLDQDKECRPYWEPGPECGDINNPLREKYPLFAISNHNNYFAHSMITSCEWRDELAGKPSVLISEAAAQERGIEQGDVVRVFNDRGEVVLHAKVTKGIQPETILLPHGWQSYDYIKGHHQDLTMVDMDPVTGNSAYYEILCQVEKYEGDVA